MAHHHARRLGLVSEEGELRLTSHGEEYLDVLLEIACMLRDEVSWGVEAVTAALNALTDWRAELPRAYKWACTLTGATTLST